MTVKGIQVQVRVWYVYLKEEKRASIRGRGHCWVYLYPLKTLHILSSFNRQRMCIIFSICKKYKSVLQLPVLDNVYV